MIQAFKKSRIGFWSVIGIALVLTVLIWIRDRAYPVFVPVIASALMLGIGIVAARLVGNILASSENTRHLGYLHMELDPKKFIRGYREVPDRMKGSSAAVSRSYLADGYAADGDYDTAISLLSQIPEDNLPVQGLYAANLAGYHLGNSDSDGAKLWLERLEEIIDACRVNKAELARNLTQMLQMHRQHLNCITGKPVDVDSLNDGFQRAQYNLRRLEIKKILAMTAIRDGDDGAKKEHLSYLRKNGGLTAYKRWADSQR
ncbi:MAG: hypothetical protein IJN20_03910 [Oscillospiraceae bacterium]|nr:hypothetical protein [Oscillospiraceae bacterium]